MLVVVGLVVKLWLALLSLALGGLPTIWSGHAIVVVPRKRKRIRRTRRSGSYCQILWIGVSRGLLITS